MQKGMAHACALNGHQSDSLWVLTLRGYLGARAKESATFSEEGRGSFGSEDNYLNWIMVVPENIENHK